MRSSPDRPEKNTRKNEPRSEPQHEIARGRPGRRTGAERAQERHASRRLWVAGGFLPAGLIACALAYAFFSLAWSLRSLRVNGKTADATVVELKMLSGEDWPSHGVCYRLRIDGVDYPVGDPLLRRQNVWATLTDRAGSRLSAVAWCRSSTTPAIHGTTIRSRSPAGPD